VSQFTIFRKLAPFVWTSPGSAATYATVTVDLTNCEPLLMNKQLSLLSLILIALKEGNKKEPASASYISWRKVQKQKVFSVSIMTPHDNEDLSFITIKNMQDKTANTIHQELQQQLKHLKTHGAAEDFRTTYKILKYIPHWLLFVVYPILHFLIHRIKIPWVPKKPFGSVIVSNVGSLGFDSALLPLTPLTRAGVMLAVGKIQDQKIQLGFTMDHRLMDGFHARKFMLGFMDVFENPTKYI
jgi:hypothetical protein